MSFEITVPRLGWSMEEGTFVRWLKNDGDYVNSGDAVFELEGEKAAQDIEAVDSGILRIPANAPKPGTIVPVGAVIGFLVNEGEAIPIASVSTFTRSEAVPGTAGIPEIPQLVSPIPHDVPAAAPSVRRLARERGLKLSSVAGSGPAGRITADDVRTTPMRSQLDEAVQTRRIASPRARRVAEELGVDWSGLKGTGRDGRVRERDVRDAVSQPRQADGWTAFPVSSRRRTIANRMKASCDRAAPVTLTTRVDATNLVSLRSQFKQSGSQIVIPSFSDIVTKLVTLVLQKHPKLAVREQDSQWLAPSCLENTHVGFAVDTDDGLVVPVIHRAGAMSLFELAKQSRTLIEKARSGKLSLSEMQGGVFTITNLGGFGVDAFTPIINLPETAILGLGRIRREPVVFDEQIVARDQMTISLTFDHRIVDGAPAARFLQSMSEAIENPSAWLLRGEG